MTRLLARQAQRTLKKKTNNKEIRIVTLLCIVTAEASGDKPRHCVQPATKFMSSFKSSMRSL
jgi:hypothetical protein